MAHRTFTLDLHRPLLAGAALVALVIVGLSLRAPGADAQQPYPQSPITGQRLQGKNVIIHLQAGAIASDNRRRESSGTDALVKINDIPVSIAGTVSGYSTEGGSPWLILSRREAGEAWIPMGAIQLIEVTPERR